MIKNVEYAGIIIAALCVDGGDVLNLAWAPNTEPLVFIIFTIFFFFVLWNEKLYVVSPTKIT